MLVQTPGLSLDFWWEVRILGTTQALNILLDVGLSPCNLKSLYVFLPNS